MRIILFGIIVLIVTSCAGNSVDKKKPIHHVSGGFRNLDETKKGQGLYKVFLWQFNKLFNNNPSVDPSDYDFDVLKNDGKKLKENSTKLSVTWIGHATTLVQVDGLNILTDPIWSERCSPVSFAGPKRYTPPGISIDDLPNIDIVVISHNHYDHMDIPTLKLLEKKFRPVFIVGLKNKKFLVKEGLTNVREMDWWESINVRNLKVTFTPTQHFSSRGVFDRDATLWGSYVLEGKKNKIYFAGDTGYSSSFKMIGEKFPEIDIAILPIGAYEPIWFMQPIHMSPKESVQSFLDLNAKYMVPMHYLTFVLTDEALDEPLKITKELMQKNSSLDRLLDLKIGETKIFSKD
ncbi:MAG: MBL fold metallo-hydrolase [Leptospiraceae bacterium]|nr:MBL fold metallo-hydrolase [Leptospiraceae bacterium]